MKLHLQSTYHLILHDLRILNDLVIETAVVIHYGCKRVEKSPIGKIVPVIGGARAYVPNSIPRHLDLTPALIYHLDEASRAVAMLAGVGETIPNPRLIILTFMRREAILSSSIEDTQAALSDAFKYEACGVRKGDVIEVANCILAL